MRLIQFRFEFAPNAASRARVERRARARRARARVATHRAIARTLNAFDADCALVIR
jgi:hypothetical protein